MLAGLWLKKLWKWSYFVIITACLLPSAYAYYDGQVNDVAWSIQGRAMWIFIFGAISTAVCVFLSKLNDSEYDKKEKTFFATMAKPVDFESEIGGNSDKRQLTIMGNASLVLGLLLCLLVFIPNPLSGRLLAGGVALTIVAIGAILRQRGKSVD